MDTFVRKGHESVKFFVGPEIEQTPAFCKKTLFVVGLQDIAEIETLAREHKTPHIFLSANRSFDSVEMKGGVYVVGDTLASDWAAQIHALLDMGFMVSLDYPAHKHVYVLQILSPAIWQSRNFVPVLSVAIPCVSTSSINLTVKIDDSNFGETNPGVWCMNHTEVTDSNRFTAWSEYGDDVVIDTTTSYAEVNKPPVNLAAAKKVVEEIREPLVISADVKEEGIPEIVKHFEDAELNPQAIGIDTESKSKLKPDPIEEAEQAKKTEVAATDALSAYTQTKVEVKEPAKKKVVKK